MEANNKFQKLYIFFEELIIEHNYGRSEEKPQVCKTSNVDGEFFYLRYENGKTDNISL